MKPSKAVDLKSYNDIDNWQKFLTEAGVSKREIVRRTKSWTSVQREMLIDIIVEEYAFAELFHADSHFKNLMMNRYRKSLRQVKASKNFVFFSVLKTGKWFTLLTPELRKALEWKAAAIAAFVK